MTFLIDLIYCDKMESISSTNDNDRDERKNNPSAHRSANNLFRFLYIACGVVFFGLGIAGTVLPLLPTTPLIVLAAVCFGKSSQRLHKWCISTRFYKDNVESFVKQRTMTVKAKLFLLSTVTLVMGISFAVLTITNVCVIVRIILSIIWLCHVVYFGFVLKTKKVTSGIG
ncbi:MAG: YbaN family protein [Oscillospiraceae bacterium]|nr:YbaN family protein [Oscillospiraceae bacterium]